MRLLNVKTMQLEEYVGDQFPKYAILSHCWGIGEVTFQDINGPNWRNMPGYAKIDYASRQSESDGIDYVWVDTCCIDKSSSAELSESINSMYRWYQKSAVCYAYLEDVTSIFSEVNLENLEFRCSRWFTRGWTLQELIAPATVLFFGKDWIYLGNKSNLSSLISSITRIHEVVVRDPYAVSRVSVAKRMSWAASRETTRIEDVAYSLLGIFDVNMPLLYGEGEKAFIRLQEEILKESDDQSLFAWNPPGRYDVYNLGILATHPKCFIGSGSIIPIPSTMESQSYSMTNKGLHIKIPISNWLENYCIARLGCQFENDFSGYLGIELVKTNTPNVYRRGHPRLWNTVMKCTANETAQMCEIYISKKTSWGSMGPEQYDVFLVMSDSMRHDGYHIVEVVPTSPHSILWDSETQVLKRPLSNWWAALKFYNSKLGFGFFVILYRSSPDEAVKILDIPPDGTLKELFFGDLPIESYNTYRFMRTVHARDGEQPTTPLEVIAKVEKEERLDQSVFVLEVRIGNTQGRFSFPKCVH